MRGQFIRFVSPASVLLMMVSIRVTAIESVRRFTVDDDIGLTTVDEVLSSPNHRYFAVISVVGRLDLNCPESTLRVYELDGVRRFVENERIKSAPLPLWIIHECAHSEGPNISDVRWLADSSGLVFLAKTHFGNDQLLLADLKTRSLQPMTPAGVHVTAFDVRRRSMFVYTALSPKIDKRSRTDKQSISIVATGRTLPGLIFPEQGNAPDIWRSDLSELWVVRSGQRHRVLDFGSGLPLSVHLEGQRSLTLSPDGRKVLTALTVSTIPKDWEQMYPSPAQAEPYRIIAGKQDPDGFSGQRDISEYVVVDLGSGRVHHFIDAPIGNGLGWWGLSHAEWSSDGRSVVLSDTFLTPANHDVAPQENAPCVVASELATGRSECLMQWADRNVFGDSGKGRLVYSAGFDSLHGKTIIVTYRNADGLDTSARFHQKSDGSWGTAAGAPQLTHSSETVDVSIQQSLNSPPLLLVTDRRTGTSRVLWDPNQPARHIELGNVSVFKWRDETGRDWVGGLYMPPDYAPGDRYPLVIQTHGFNEHTFAPSGSFPTAFAAQELATAGFLVLQVRDCPIRMTPEEALCQLRGYKAAIEKLSSMGVIDANRVGIIGFSRTCYYVLAALTNSLLHFRAAAITDGVDEGYFQYLLNLDSTSDNSVAGEADAIIGAQPFGAGLEKWLQESPPFNMDKVATPLQVVTTTHEVLQMWECYATLRYLHKPVEFVVLKSDEHVLTNPAVRRASQGGTVDWFRFWLQDYKDPDPRKGTQYARWEILRGMTTAFSPASGSAASTSKQSDK